MCTPYVHRILVLLALMGGAGCVGMPSPTETRTLASVSGTLGITVTMAEAQRHVAAVGAEVEQVVVEVTPTYLFTPTEQRTPVQLKRLDKAMWATGPASVSFSGMGIGGWEIRVNALDATGRVIGSGSGHASLASGQSKQVSIPVRLEPTVTASGTGSLRPNVTVALPLPTAGVVTWSQTMGTLLESIWGFDAAGALCVPFKVSVPGVGTRLGGYHKYDADGVKVGTVTFQTPPTIGTGFLEPSGNAWVVSGGGLIKFGPDGQEIGNYALSNYPSYVSGVDPTGTMWVQTSQTEMTRVSSTGAVLGTHALLQPADMWIAHEPLVFDPQSGHLWMMSAKRLIKVSPAGALVATVSFPAPEVLLPFEGDVVRLLASAVDSAGNLWVARSDGRLFKVSPNAQVVGQYTGVLNARWMKWDHDGKLWVLSETLAEHNLTQFSAAGLPVGRNGLKHLPLDMELAPDGAFWFIRRREDDSGPLPLLARLVP